MWGSVVAGAQDKERPWRENVTRALSNFSSRGRQGAFQGESTCQTGQSLGDFTCPPCFDTHPIEWWHPCPLPLILGTFVAASVGKNVVAVALRNFQAGLGKATRRLLVCLGTLALWPSSGRVGSATLKPPRGDHLWRTMPEEPAVPAPAWTPDMRVKEPSAAPTPPATRLLLRVTTLSEDHPAEPCYLPDSSAK